MNGSPPFTAARYLGWVDWYFFARPVLMPPVWTILLLSAAPISAAIPVNALPATLLRVWLGLGLGFLLFGGVYVFNQIFDIESDRQNRKLFFLPEGIIRLRFAIAQYAVFTVGAVIGGAALGRTWLVATLAIVVLGILYSVPAVRLKDRPLGGLIANAVGHGTLAYYLGRALGDPQSVPVWGESTSYAFAVAAVYLLTTIPDRAGDATTGKSTVAVRFGSRVAAAAAVMCVLAAGLAAIHYRQWPVAISAGVSLPWFALTVAAERLCRVGIRVALLTLSFFACLAFWPYIFILLFIWVSTRWYYRRRFGVRYPRFGGGG